MADDVIESSRGTGELVLRVTHKTVDAASPYYLHSSDHPGLIFVTQILLEIRELFYMEAKLHEYPSLEEQSWLCGWNNKASKCRFAKFANMDSMQSHGYFLVDECSCYRDTGKCCTHKNSKGDLGRS